MSELNKTLIDIATPSKITVTPFEPVDLESTELFCSDLTSMNRMSYVLTVLRERHPILFDEIYKESEKRLANDDR